MRLVTVEEMKEIERVTILEYQLREDLIIENVGLQGAHLLEKNFFKEPDLRPSFVFLIGKGNNGADGLAIARNLVNKTSAFIMAFLLFPEEECSVELKHQLHMARSFGLRSVALKSVDDMASYFFQTGKSLIVIDAIFGSGVRLPLPNMIYDVIRFINQQAQTIVSIDIPSGVEGNTGNTTGQAVTAQWTMSIGAPKLGCFLSEGVECTGEIQLVDAGFPQEFFQEGDKFQIEFSDVMDWLESRSKYADKRMNGHVLVVGGSSGLTGALLLATNAALRVGTGLVTGVTWKENHQEFTSRLIPEIMSGLIPEEENKWREMMENFSRYHALVVGPGLGRGTKARAVLQFILTEYRGPVVVDADAINLLILTEDETLLRNRKFPTILTPHLGEFARLLNINKNLVARDSYKYLLDLVYRTSATVILKGPCSQIAFPSGKVYFNFSPNAGMATGGTGDVLAGILGGVISQEVARFKKTDKDGKDFPSLEKSILLAVLVHSRSGHFAKEKYGVRGMTASSLIDCLTDAFDEIEKMI